MDGGEKKEKRYPFKVVHSPVSAEAETTAARIKRTSSRGQQILFSFICELAVIFTAPNDLASKRGWCWGDVLPYCLPWIGWQCRQCHNILCNTCHDFLGVYCRYRSLSSIHANQLALAACFLFKYWLQQSFVITTNMIPNHSNCAPIIQVLLSAMCSGLLICFVQCLPKWLSKQLFNELLAVLVNTIEYCDWFTWSPPRPPPYWSTQSPLRITHSVLHFLLFLWF